MDDNFLKGFLCSSCFTGTTFAFFQISGNIPSFRGCSNIILKRTVNDSLQILIIFIDILSQPWALARYKFVITDMFSSVKWNDLILALVLYENNGDMLQFFIGVHIDPKKLLKRFAISIKSETNLPLTNKGGTAGSFSCKVVCLK